MEDILCNNIKIICFVNSPVPSNAYLLIDGTGANCIVIDPGSKEQSELRDYIQSHNLILDYIILTHEHFDHCWGVNYLLETFPAKVVVTKLCAEWVKTPKNYFNKLYFDSDEMYFIKNVDILAEEIDWRLKWRGNEIVLLDAKGHTNRGMCIKIGNALFSGDTLIYNTKPFIKKKYGGSVEDLKETIDEIYHQFDSKTTVYPGHGETFKLGQMKEFYEEYFKKQGFI